METIVNWFRMRPLRLLGGFLVFLSIGLLIFLLLLDILGKAGNPYVGIITYMILPAVLTIGLLLVPFDAWLQRRRAAHGLPPYPVIDLCNPKQRKIASFFLAASVLVLIVMTVVTYKSVEYMDTTGFCGTTCHKVMMPEYEAYLRSPHASVECSHCHIGPGAPFFVRAKLSGIPQVWHYTLGDYPRPLHSPVKALRPSRDTCENCHWPKQFYGSMLRTNITYQPDKDNTKQINTMTMHVGSGGVPGSGIHSHIIGKIDYLPAVENRSEIAWVRVRRADGSAQEFVNPSYTDKLKKIRREQSTRFMDCIDCHNRAAHDFVTFEKLLDSDLTMHKVDPTIPFIKKQAMEAVGESAGIPTQAQQDRAVKRIDAIRSYYQRELPDVYKTRKADIDRSVSAVKAAYLASGFPHMKTGPETFPSWASHTGCFRCHGTLVAAGPKGRDKDIPANCDLCHDEPGAAPQVQAAKP